MALKRKITDAIKKARPFLMQVSEDASADTALKELEAVLQALETHKDSADHDDDAHVWTALNKFMQVMEVSGIMPIVGDSADIGSPTHLFRKGFFSELSTLIFKKENVLVMDGTFVLCKQSGKFVADVAASDTQIDFGQALTVGDILILRAENKMEYMRVGTKVSGTASTYNVTRNLDGTGADAWPAESVYFVRGKAGDGWIELTATSDQRMSVFIQGANWNQNTEVVRIGKLDGWQNAGLTGLGLVIGNYATKEYMVYDTATKKMFVSGEVNAGNNAARLYQFGIALRGEGSACTFYDTGTGTVPLGRLQLLFDPHYPDNTWVSLKHNKRVEIIGGNLGNISKITVTENDGVAIKGNTDIQGTIGSSDIVTVPGADKIPRADADGKIDAGWIPALSYAPRQEMVGLKRTTAQSIPRAAWTSIIWNSEDYDTFNFWTSGSAVHAYNAGIYNISAYVGTSGMDSGLFTVGIFINSESVPRLQQNASVYSGGIHILLSGALKLELGDIVYVKIYHNNATALSTLTSQPSRLHLCWISN